jgi:hypothetical protein
MAELDPHSSAPAHDSAKGTATNNTGGPGPHVNGTTDASATDASGHSASDGQEHRSGFARAEELVDHLAEKAASLTSAGGRKVLWFMSRAREVAEDFWADVQDFRNGKNP